MTRIAIVAASEELRAALAAALRADPAFEVLSVAASEGVGDVNPAADVVLVARSASHAFAPVRSLQRDVANEVVPSNRERQILALLGEGLSNKQIAARLGISTNTVKTHLELLFEKLGVSSRAEAVAAGVKRGLLLL